jgi:hypothetical protein
MFCTQCRRLVRVVARAGKITAVGLDDAEVAQREGDAHRVLEVSRKVESGLRGSEPLVALAEQPESPTAIEAVSDAGVVAKTERQRRVLPIVQTKARV